MSSQPNHSPPPLHSDPVAGLPPGYHRKRQIPAWLMSFFLHLALFLLLILAIRSASQGASETESRSGGIVLVNLDSQQTEYLSEGETADSSSAAEPASDPPPSASDLDLPPELPGLAASPAPVTGVGDEFTQSLPGADGMLEGPSTSRPIGGKVTTEVFGVKGTGSRFVYVFDRSASMEGYNKRPLIAAKQALMASIQSLGEIHQFQIIFYNDSPLIFDPEPGPPQMYFADERMKRKATQFIQSITGDRGTDHVKALKAAMDLGPDVIFLLTDAEGGFTRAEMALLSNWNRSGAVINAIEFGAGGKSADRSLERLAREHGGQYSYKNIATLRLNQ